MSTRLASLLGVAAVLAVLASLIAAPITHADPDVAGSSKLMLVMDSSGSMKEKLPDGSTKIAAARSALSTVIDGLPESQPVGFRVYGATVFDKSDKDACTDSQQTVGLGTDNRDQLKAAVKKYKPYGETPTGYALQQAGTDLGSDGQRTIVLVSDGEPTCAPDPCQVAADLAKDGIQLKIEVVGLDVSAKARKTLKCVADKTHGHYYDADGADDLGRALDTVATRSLRPYQPIGTPITGTETPTGGPELKPGDWLDQIGGHGQPRDDLYYTLHRTIPGSTLHISATLSKPGQNDDYLNIGLIGANGTKCSSGSSWGTKDLGVTSVGLMYPGWDTDDEEVDCTSNNDFTVRIERPNHAAGTPSPLEIRVQQEPPVADADDLPDDLPEAEYQSPSFAAPTKIAGGSSFAEATKITPGSYSANIVPGELQLFQVPVGWGQQLTAGAKVKPLSERLSDEASQSRMLRVSIFSPSRGEAMNFSNSDWSYLTSDGAEAGTVSPAVMYNNRDFGSDGRRRNASQAGNYFIAVRLDDDKGRTYQVPYTLGVSVDGKVQGEPSYLKDGIAPTVTPSASASDTPSAKTTADNSPTPTVHQTTAQHGDDRGSKSGRTSTLVSAVGWTAGALGLAAVIGGAVLLTYFIRRR